MALPPTVTVKCPQCEHIYIAWHVPSVGIKSETAHQPSATCSQCGHRAVLSELSEKDGVFQQVVKP